MGTDRLNGLALAYVHRTTPEPLQILQKWDASYHRRTGTSLGFSANKSEALSREYTFALTIILELVHLNEIDIFFRHEC